MRNFILLLAVTSLIPVSCTSNKEADASAKKKDLMLINDPHSFSRPLEARGIHLQWNAAVDFASKTISGEATWTIESSADASEIIFDTRGLTIHTVTENGKSLAFTLSDTIDGRPWMGRALHVPITPASKQITIAYTTSPDAAALQWLAAEQTRDKKHPFLFTQSQAILARTWLPCQDGPGLRFTFDAQVQVPQGMIALMSAENPQTVSADGKYAFHMEQPIPSYLMSMAVGDLAFRS